MDPQSVFWIPSSTPGDWYQIWYGSGGQSAQVRFILFPVPVERSFED